MIRRFLKAPASIVLFTLIAAVALQVFLRPDLVFAPQFWAEDGKEWFLSAYSTKNAFKTLFLPYGGYIQLFPRLTALVAQFAIPLQYIPLFYNLTAIVFSALALSLFTHPTFRSIIQKDYIRVALVLLIFLINPAWETQGTITNSQWFLGVGAVLLTWIPQRLTWCCVSLLAILISSFSTPTLIFLTPLVFPALVAKDLSVRGKGITLLASVLAHYLVTHLFGSGQSIPLEVPALLHNTINTSISMLLVPALGYSWSRFLYTSLGNHAAYIAIIVWLTSLYLVVLQKSPSKTIFAAASTVCLFGYILGVSLLRQAIFPNGASEVILRPETPGFNSYNHSRYLFIPFVLIVTNYSVLFAAALSRYAPIRLQSSLLFSLVLIIGLTRYNRVPSPDYLNWDLYAKKLSSGWSGEIPIQPTAYGWTIKVRSSNRRSQNQRQHLSFVDLLATKSDDSNNKRLIRWNGGMIEAFFQHPPSLRAVKKFPSGKAFVTHFGLDPRARNLSNGVTFQVKITTAKGKILHNYQSDPNDQTLHQRWQCVELPIPASDSTGALRVEFKTSDNGSAGHDWALWINPHFSNEAFPCRQIP